MSRALGLLLGFAADRLFGDPQRFHPVAGFGRTAGALERRIHSDGRARGVLHVGLLVGGSVVLGSTAERTVPGAVARTVLTAAATWAVLGGTSLDREAAAVQARLADDDLPGARRRVARIVGRDVSVLDAAGVARAAVETVAENTADAVVAPLVWGALAGVPGLLGYRAANTLDAMVGHHSNRYERFGWAAARLDDVLNVPGSRLTALLAVGLAPTIDGDPRGAVRAWRRDAGGHPSPNAGPVEAAFAGALGVRLGGVNVYAGRTEDRHVLGDGHDPDHHDLHRARTLARRVDVGAVLVTASLAHGLAVIGRRSRPARRRRRAR